MRRMALFVGIFLVSLGCLDVALGRVSHASLLTRGFVSRSLITKGLQVQTLEPGTRLQEPDLQGLYQEINRESFGGALPEVPVRWGELTKADAYGITHFERGVPYAMELDRNTVLSRSFALDVIRHESCHIATNVEVRRRKEDPHGATFVACMERIQDNETGD